MTKAIRIENADTSNHKVKVFRETKNEANEWVHSGQRLVVEAVE